MLEYLQNDRLDNTDRLKINQKFILLLQFIEQMFLERKNELSCMPEFADMMAVLMFVLDKQKILWFDFPDKGSDKKLTK